MTSEKTSPTIWILLLSVLVLPACQLTYALSALNATPTATRARTVPTTARQPTAEPAPTETAALPAATAAPVTASVQENLRVRATPSTAAAVIDRLNKGDVVSILGRTDASDWWQIELPSKPGTYGWVSAEFAVADGPTDKVPVVEPGSPPPSSGSYP